jgi:cytochrome c
MKASFANMRLIPAALLVAGILAGPVSAQEQDGALLFKRQCAVCHSVVPGQTLMGPSLAGVVGRPAGSVERFRYSKAMREAGFTWTAEEIDAFIESPRKHVPGTNMAYPGERHPEKRAAIIEYLGTLAAGD